MFQELGHAVKRSWYKTLAFALFSGPEVARASDGFEVSDNGNTLLLAGALGAASAVAATGYVLSRNGRKYEPNPKHIPRGRVEYASAQASPAPTIDPEDGMQENPAAQDRTDERLARIFGKPETEIELSNGAPYSGNGSNPLHETPGDTATTGVNTGDLIVSALESSGRPAPYSADQINKVLNLHNGQATGLNGRRKGYMSREKIEHELGLEAGDAGRILGLVADMKPRTGAYPPIQRFDKSLLTGTMEKYLISEYRSGKKIDDITADFGETFGMGISSASLYRILKEKNVQRNRAKARNAGQKIIPFTPVFKKRNVVVELTG